MSDDESPDNVIPIPRIGSLPPPAVPPVPVLAGDGESDSRGNVDADFRGGGEPETGRISPFDMPAPSVTPPPPGVVPATFRSEGTDENVADAGPPRPGALSMAAILAIALAAFEGIQAWVAESGPRRAEAAKHKREMELLAAKARADAAKLTAEAGAERAKAQRNRGVQSSHEFGKRALGRSPGGSGRGGGPSGPGGSSRAPSGPSGGSTGGRGQRNAPGKPGSSGGTSSGSPNGSTGKGSGRPGSGGSGSGGAGGGRGPGNRGGGSNGAAPSGSSGPSGASKGGSKHGRTTLPQAVGNTLRDRWNRRSPATPVLSKTSQPGSAGKGAPGSVNGTAKNGPKAGGTLPGGANGAPKGSPKQPGGIPPGSVNGTAKGGAKPSGPGSPEAGKASGKTGGRTTFWQAVGETMDDRWKKRRGAVTGCINNPNPNAKSSPPKGGTSTAAPGGGTAGGPKNTGTPKGPGPGSGAQTGKGPWKHGPSSGPGSTGPGAGKTPGPAGSGPAAAGPAGPGTGPNPGFTWARASPWDFAQPAPATHTVVQDGPASRNGTPWEPTPIAPARPSLPQSGPPALPRAPQRAAGQRPGTTRRKEAIPMEPAPVGTYSVTQRPGGMAARHATEITAGDACRALEKLTTQGMEAHDDYDALSKAARKLLSALENISADLAGEHNVASNKIAAALAELMNQVTGLIRSVDRAAKDCLDAAELSEAEEHALKRDHQPVTDATADAGLATPSARLHNEN